MNLQAVSVAFIKISNNAIVPDYKSLLAAGADLHACLAEPIMLAPRQRTLVPTGLAIAIPEGYEAQVRPRSGLALHKGITCLNSPGTIDADYRGEIGVILINLGSEDFEISHADRIAQLVIAPVVRADFVSVSSLPESQRSGKGFGSTGGA